MELPDGLLSTACAFCDSPLVDHRLEETERPDRVVPFRVPRARAGRALAQFLAGEWLAPEALRRAIRPSELSQVFVPFYCYDALVRSEFTASVGLYWYRTETYTTTVNGKRVTRTRRVRETEWSPLSGSHARRWFDHLVSASTGVPEEEANQLEPFDLGLALPYGPALVAGVPAELPTVTHEQALKVAGEELAALERKTIAQSHLPGDTHRRLQSSSRVDVDVVRLVLLPIWTAVYPGPSGPVRLLVNGQTGEVVGAVPRSTWKIGCLIATVLGLIGGFVAILFAGTALSTLMVGLAELLGAR